ncbi:soluble quino protein glucose dehydrogenase [Xylariomycetidae sp. FL2044]|nr:soluble quino protein glucose dehydrogenase [Xylariomycetidae sp. FL2044]
MTRHMLLIPLGLLASRTAAQDCVPIEASAQLNIAEGYTATVVMNGLAYPRDMVFDTAGNLLVNEQNGGGIRRIELTESEDGTVCAGMSNQIIPDPSLNHGIAFSQDGKTLFVSSMSSVYAYPYDAEVGAAGARKILIEGMSSGGHTTRTLLTPVTAPDVLLVSRGSDGNIDNSTVDTAAAKSIIKAFSILELMAAESPTDYATGGEILGWGLRNSVGLGEDPSTGGIWSVENSADDIRRSTTDLHNDNPAEELNYHGVVASENNNNTFRGANYGYPACFSAWQTEDIPANEGITVGSQFGGVENTPFQQVAAAESMADVDEFCRTQRQGPRLVFPSHTAPLDVKFKEDGSVAFVAFHGSWNRDPPDGFRLGRIEFADGQPVAEVSDTSAVTYIVQNRNNTACPDACIRPVGLAFDAKGRLFMSSDATGEIYLIGGA